MRALSIKLFHAAVRGRSGLPSVASFSASFGTFVSSLPPDVHRFGAGVCKPVQRPGDLHQGPHGALPGGEFLRGLATHVRTKALLLFEGRFSHLTGRINSMRVGRGDLRQPLMTADETHSSADDFML